MDIEEFYDQNPARRTSEEFEFGRDWSDADGNHAEISWVHDTGELYLMTAPFEPIVASGLPGDEHVPRLPTNKVVVEVLGVYPSVEAVEELLAGWRDAMGGQASVPWVRDRIAHPGAAGGAGASSGDEPTELPGAHPTR
jgi:hypothetical protein